MRLDEEKLEALRRWGQGLRGAGSEEHAAAGRAILLLIEEVERLRIELLRARERRRRAGPGSAETVAEESGGPLASTLQGRLQRTLREPGPGTEAEGAIRSPEAWIESLRRQK